MAKEIIDAIKEAELNGRYNVENAKDEAESRVTAARSEFEADVERRVFHAEKAAQQLLDEARSEAMSMLEAAEQEAAGERDRLFSLGAERKDQTIDSIIAYLFR